MKIKLLIASILISITCYSQTYFKNISGGYLGDNINFAASPTAYFLLHNSGTPSFIPELIKLDVAGNFIWSRTIVFSGNPVRIFRIKYDNNSLYISGSHTNGGLYKNFLSKIDTSGSIVWTTESDYVEINTNTRVHTDNSGILIVGQRDYLGTTAPDYTFDITLLRLDPSGAFGWAKAYGNDTFDFIANASVEAPNGELMVAGNYGVRSPAAYKALLARFDTNGGLIWMKTLSDHDSAYADVRPNDIIPTSDGNFVISAYSKDTSGNADVFVIKINGSGNVLWSKRLYQSGWQEYGNSIIEDSQHKIVVSGPCIHLPNYGDFVAKLDLSGNYESAFEIVNTNDDAFYFNSIYNGNGQGLMEKDNTGYVLSSVYRTVNIGYRHYLIHTNYDGTTSCDQQPSAYPFTAVDDPLDEFTFVTLPTALTNISTAPVTFARYARNDSVISLCTTVGLNEIENEFSQINVYPNPTKGKLFIQLKNSFSDNLKIEMFDCIGKKVKEMNLNEKMYHGAEIPFDVALLPSGIYFIKFNNGTKFTCKKIILE